MKKKTLFISSMLNVGNTGGGVVARRNQRVLRQILGEQNIITYNLTPWERTTNFSTIWNRFRRLLGCHLNGASKKIEEDIISLINLDDIECVFVDSSLNGILIEKIKKSTSAKVISFFHNCETSLIRQGAMRGEKVGWLRYLPAYINEKKTVQYSDKILSLNVRDSDLLLKSYGREADCVIPVTLSDSEDAIPPESSPMHDKELLFVGSNFFPNIEGACWFIKNILGQLEGWHLSIVGKGLSSVTFPDSLDYDVYSDVDSLAPYYHRARAVVVPILSGGGMKVKVAEALKFGKLVFVTPEAYHGYEGIDSVIECQNSSDFISGIKKLNETAFQHKSRETFLERYSDSVAMNLFTELIDSL